jgi:cyclopropane fatty-acyl-phospholipid synthase-like methyltransferase
MFGYYLVIFLSILFLLGMTLFFAKKLSSALVIFQGPIFVRSEDDRLASMFELAKPKKGERIIDLGSGDGKILIELAKRGLKAEGVEINSALVKESERAIKKLGLEKKVKVTRASFWDFDLSGFDLVFFYGMSHVMRRMEKKLLVELKPGARVVSNYFQFPSWEPEKKLGEARLYRR